MGKAIDLDKPLSDADKLFLHERSQDYLIEENERKFAQRKLHDAGEPIDVKGALEKAGVEPPDAPPNPSYVGAMGSVQQGPLIVEGEDNAGRVPLPRDHPLTQEVDDGEGTGIPAAQDEWDGKSVRAEINTLTVDELKDNLRDLDEPVSGDKAELQKRLFAALKKANEGK